MNLNGFSPLTQTHHPVISSSAQSALGLRSQRLALKVLSAGAADICCRSAAPTRRHRQSGLRPAVPALPAPFPRHAPCAPLNRHLPSCLWCRLVSGCPFWGTACPWEGRRDAGGFQSPALALGTPVSPCPHPPWGSRGGEGARWGEGGERREPLSFLHTAATCFASRSSSLARK